MLVLGLGMTLGSVSESDLALAMGSGSESDLGLATASPDRRRAAEYYLSASPRRCCWYHSPDASEVEYLVRLRPLASLLSW